MPTSKTNNVLIIKSLPAYKLVKLVNKEEFNFILLDNEGNSVLVRMTHQSTTGESYFGNVIDPLESSLIKGDSIQILRDQQIFLSFDELVDPRKFLLEKDRPAFVRSNKHRLWDIAVLESETMAVLPYYGKYQINEYFYLIKHLIEGITISVDFSNGELPANCVKRLIGEDKLLYTYLWVK